MNIFSEIGLILIITTLIATLARLFKQPLVVGYVLSGVIVGPYVLDIFSSHHEIELFSKIGIAILLFIVGIHLNPETLRETGKSALLAGTAQILLTSLFGFAVVRLFGFDNISAVIVAFALTLSSTIVVLKLLADKNELSSLHGKLLIGLLLVQDIAATIGLVVLPLIGKQEMSSTPLGFVLLKLLLIGGACGLVLTLVAKYILPRFSDYLAKSHELLLLFSISWGLILAALFSKIGFSIEVGALAAGITLASSRYAEEIAARMTPLRDFFVVMFFVLLGAGLVLNQIASIAILVLVLSFFVLIGNPLIVFYIMSSLGYSSKTAFKTGLAIGQVSEFSLIFLALAHSQNIVSTQIITIVTLTAIITMIGSSYMVMNTEKIYSWCKNILDKTSFSFVSKKDETEKVIQYDIIIFGYGRVGIEFIDKALSHDYSVLVVDFNPEVFGGERAEGVHYLFGDASDPQFLDTLPFETVSYVVSTIPDIETNNLLQDYVHGQNSEVITLFVSQTVSGANLLYEKGATYVILPHYLGAYHATEMLSQHQSDKSVFTKAKEVQAKQIKKHHPTV